MPCWVSQELSRAPSLVAVYGFELHIERRPGGRANWAIRELARAPSLVTVYGFEFKFSRPQNSSTRLPIRRVP